MSLIVLFMIAVGLSMDAVAVAMCLGLPMAKVTARKALVIGIYFGAFQGIMPVIGYFLASQFFDKVTLYENWIAFLLLSVIGGKMIWDSLRKDDKCENNEKQLDFKTMLPLAVATSIDAFAIGVSFAFLKVNIINATLIIGITTLVLSMAGVKIGSLFGNKFRSKAEFIGGMILVLIGLKMIII